MSSSDLFSQQQESDAKANAPLAARLRPEVLSDYFGQEHLLGNNGPLRLMLDQKSLHSMILWGPPGVGKTTLARLLAQSEECDFLTLSAVMAGIKEIREVVAKAKQNQTMQRRTVLFVDEVHRFNKSQQDAFLPYVEDGTFIFIGATTENPSFELNNALLSRARVYVLKSMDSAMLVAVLQRALVDELGFAGHYQASDEVLLALATAADGDARSALNLLEIASQLSANAVISMDVVSISLQNSFRRFDKGGDAFYDQISALQKSIRGSDPQGSLYWFARMIDGGCDPLYIARRVVRMASEEIGNADPRAMTISLNAWDVQQRLGSPEGELAIAQAVSYLACAAKSNAVYKAFNAAMAMVKQQPSYDVPMHLRNAPTKLGAELGYGEDYRYAHNEENAFAAGENYFPEEIKDTRFYYPVERGLEQKIAEKLRYLDELNKTSNRQRYSGSKEGSEERSND
ncbi:recombination factor protein RarA [Oleispira antarctica]|uniref:Replication-associated recombination protein A n=1 Tax=Oleispira antarctica TaxID=188908 RepID=A0A1Y5HWV7_OLEAN|nr:recombination factor protein RarA [Oleispira antarctica]